METRESIQSLVARTGAILSVSAHAALVKAQQEENTWIDQRIDQIRNNFHAVLATRKAA